MQDISMSADLTGVITRGTGEKLNIYGCKIGKRIFFEVAPKGFNRVQLRSVGREEFDMQITAAA